MARRWTRPLWGLFAFAAGCQAPGIKPPALSAPAIEAADFRADGVSRKEVVIRLEAGRSLPAKFKIKRAIAAIGAALVEVPAGRTPEALIAELKPLAGVGYADPVQHVAIDTEPSETAPGFGLAFLPNDPLIADQYALAAIHAQEAWNVTRGDRKTVLAILDSGTDLKHPEIAPQIVAAFNVLTRTPEVRDGKGHGTHTAGIAAAAGGNAVGISGVAPACGLMVVQVGGMAGASDASAAEGLVWAVDHGARVASMSFGKYRRSRVFEAALQYALDHDVVLVGSAGNEGVRNDPTSAPHLPSTHPGVIEVAATDQDNLKAKFSNFGQTLSVSAPGVKIVSAIPGAAYTTKSGTSMAAPCVAGVAALVRSKYPDLTWKQVRQRIEASAKDLGEPGFDEIFGHGLVDAAAALGAQIGSGEATSRR